MQLLQGLSPILTVLLHYLAKVKSINFYGVNKSSAVILKF